MKIELNPMENPKLQTMSLVSSLLLVFEEIRKRPAILREKHPEMVVKLQSQANPDSQGTGNKVTDQEAAFAFVMETIGFHFQPKYEALPTSGLHYLYQLNGSQKSIDFRVFETVENTMVWSVDLDLKHTTSDVFYLNDGWFHKDVIYVITWERRTSEPRKAKKSEVATFLALGQDIPSADETAMMNELIALKTKCNTDNKGVDSLCTYIRFANRYKCTRFTPEHTETCFQTIVTHLHSSSDSSVVVSAAV